MIADAKGDLFGTTTYGGAYNFGTVFEMVDNGSSFISTTLFSFNNTDGYGPTCSLLADSSGDLFGTTTGGGASTDGTVFELVKNGSTWSLITLISFNGTDGRDPFSGLIADANGDLFGTTRIGGASNDGTVFELVKNGSSYSLVTLVSFSGTNGANPEAAVIADSSGDLFGTTFSGGTSNYGTAFELVKGSSTWTLSTLVSFNYPTGAYPVAGLIMDASGDLFGVTSGGLTYSTVFELAKSGSTYTLNTLATFSGFSSPSGTLISDSNGDLFGTTIIGGASNNGSVYELLKSGSSYVFSNLLSFSSNNGSEDGPEGGLVTDSNGDFFGTTVSGGTANEGTVFELSNDFVITATDAAGATTSEAYSIDIPSLPIITTTTLAAGDVNQPYDQVIAASGGSNLVSFTVTAGALPPGLSLNESTGAIVGTPTATIGSPYNFTIMATDETGATTSQTLSLSINPNLTITTTSLPNWTVGQTYSQTVSTNGGTNPIAFAVSAGTLPTGLSLDSNTGAITGSPLTTTGSPFAFTITATDAANSVATKNYSMVIDAALMITTSTLPNWTVNQPYSQSVAVSGGTNPDTFAVTAGSLPMGLSLNSSTGTITGTPTTTSISPVAVTVTVTDAAGATANHVYSITINAAPTVTTNSLPSGTQNDSYSTTLSSSGGTGTVTWSVTSGSLPAGLSLNSSTGVISGSPSISNFANTNLGGGGNPQGGLIEDSQGNLFGTTRYGGAISLGSVFEVAAGSNAAITLLSFNGVDGSQPEGTLYEDAVGDLIGTTYAGGTFGDGTVFEISAVTHALTTLVNFNGTDGANPMAGLVADSAGNLYGTTYSGGSSNDGTIYNISATSHALTTLVNFNSTNGANPETALLLDSVGDIFGTTNEGGSSGLGIAFEVAAGTTAVTTLVDFNHLGYGPSSLIMDSAGDLFGTTTYGGGYGGGTVFEIAAGTDSLMTLATFIPDDINGNAVAGNPAGGLVMDSAGDLFGTSGPTSGTNTSGAVFEVAAGTHAMSTLVTFTGIDGIDPISGLVMNSAGDLFGTTYGGDDIGDPIDGTVFEVVAGTHALTTLATFTNNGVQPQAALVADSAGDLFGTTGSGGTNGCGTVFEIAAGTNVVTTLVNFDWNAQETPDSPLLVDSAGNLFGTTIDGGSNYAGTLFEVAAGTHSLTTLVNFNSYGEPEGSLVEDSAGDIFGTDYSGPFETYGAVFEVAAGTHALSFPYRFTQMSSGAYPESGLMADSAGDIFGTTSAGGTYGDGTVFEIAAGTHAFTTLANFNSTDGASPGVIVLDGAGDIFGVTSAGGSSNDGTVFEIAAGTQVLTTLANFNGNNGKTPEGLAEDSAGDLVGTTSAGGGSGDGTVFEIAAGTKALTTLFNFNGKNGNNPMAGLLTDGRGDLFGTTYSGGATPSGNGTVFEISGSAQITVTATDSTGASVSQKLALVIQSSPTFTTTALPDGDVGTQYNQTISTTGGTGLVSYAVSSGNLPPGLTLDEATGALLGTPTSSSLSPYTFTITATDTQGDTGSQAYTLTINPPLTITTATLPAWTVGRSYNQMVSVTGGTGPLTFTVSAGNLPTGLSLNTTSGVIIGMPTTTSGSPFVFTITANDASDAVATQSYSVSINAAPTITTTTLPNWTINRAYSQTVSISGGTNPESFAVTSGSLPTGLSLNSSTGAITGTPTTASDSPLAFTITVTDATSAMASNGYTVVINPAAMITTTTLPNWTVTQPYSQTITVRGGTGPDSFALTSGSLPTGLSLNTSTGAITGTPTTTTGSPFTFTITTTDSIGATASQAYAVTINPSLSISPTSVVIATPGLLYDENLTVLGGTSPNISVTGFNGGATGLTSSFVTVNPGTDTILLSGIPSSPGVVDFTVNASDGTGDSLSQNYTITVFGIQQVAVTPSGVVITFNALVNPASTVLYSSPGDKTIGPPDVTLVGATTGPVRGSLVIDPIDPNVVTFVQTSGLLVTDTYKLTVTTGVTALGGGSLGSAFTTTLNVTAPDTPVLTVPSFARGAGQAVDVPTDNSGIPISISNATDVTQASFTLSYDPTILTIAATGALTPTTGLTNVAYTITSVDSHHSVLTANLSGGTGLSAVQHR